MVMVSVASPAKMYTVASLPAVPALASMVMVTLDAEVDAEPLAGLKVTHESLVAIFQSVLEVKDMVAVPPSKGTSNAEALVTFISAAVLGSGLSGSGLSGSGSGVGLTQHAISGTIRNNARSLFIVLSVVILLL